MISISIPCQIYSKDMNVERSAYHVISAPELVPYQKKIDKEINFQWISRPDSKTTIYLPVWYFLPLNTELGLLCLFEDAGSDPRPHVLRRIVGLCSRREHAALLSHIATEAKVTYELGSDKKTWTLALDAEHPAPPFNWEKSILNKADPSTYQLGSSPIVSPPSIATPKASKSKLIKIKTNNTKAKNNSFFRFMKKLFFIILIFGLGYLSSHLVSIKYNKQPAPSGVNKVENTDSQDKMPDYLKDAIANFEKRNEEHKEIWRNLDNLKSTQEETFDKDIDNFMQQHDKKLSDTNKKQLRLLKYDQPSNKIPSNRRTQPKKIIEEMQSRINNNQTLHAGESSNEDERTRTGSSQALKGKF